MALSFNQFFAAIAAQESGGNYNAVSSAGALGKYQIMPANIASWSKEVLGHSITVQQFLHTPALQEQIARGKLQNYWNKYGARGAAAAWYSGKPGRQNDYSKVGNGPSVGSYVDQVLARAGQQPAGGPGGGAGKVAIPTGADAAAKYGFIADLAQSVPDIKNILNQAIKEGWDTSRFTAAVQDSKWWKTHSDSVRQRLIQKVTDPGSYKQDLGEAQRRVNQMMGQVGLGLNHKDAAFAAQQVLMGGWNDVDLHNFVGGHGHFRKDGVLGGEAAQLQAKMNQTMGDYALGQSAGHVQYAIQNVLGGHASIDDWTHRWRVQAESMFPALKAMLEQGQTVRQAADPYVQQYAQTLEINPNDIDISKDAVLRAALSGRNDKGKPDLVPMWQFGQTLRNDPRYEKTTQAKTDAFSLLHKIGTDFGFAS